MSDTTDPDWLDGCHAGRKNAPPYPPGACVQPDVWFSGYLVGEREGIEVEDLDVGMRHAADQLEVCGHYLQATYLRQGAKEIERLRALVFLPCGENHHNAVACPYCNPERRKFG